MDDREEIMRLIGLVLDGEATAEQERAIDRWLREDRQLALWFGRMIENTSGAVSPAVKRRIMRRVTAGRGRTVRQRFTPRGGVRSWFAAGGVAAAVALAAALLPGLSGRVPYDAPVQVYTGVGERSRVSLPDGSHLVLNHASTVAYRYDAGTGERMVELEGEAYFDVRTDAAHPFVVRCGDMEVQCRGTSFNVKAYGDDDEMAVVLADGAVTVASPGRSVDMRPGNMVTYSRRDGNMTTHAVTPADYSTWTQGETRFNDDTFASIMHVLSRRHGVTINIAGDTLSGTRLSGSLGDCGLDEALLMLSTAAGAGYEMVNDSTVSIYAVKR